MFAKPVHPAIVKEVLRRESIITGLPSYTFMGNRYEIKDEDLLWTTSKMCQYRICSFAQILQPEDFGYIGSNKDEEVALAKKIRLEHTFAFPEQYPDFYYEKYLRNSKKYGYNTGTLNKSAGYIKPKLTALSVENYGTFNSLRKIQFSFKVFDLYSLELYEKLYAVTGVHLTLEFWWSTSMPKTLLPVEDESQILKIFEKGEQLKYVYENNGNYEGIIARISSFDYTKETDLPNSWTINVKAISPQLNALYSTNTDKPIVFMTQHFKENNFLKEISGEITNNVCSYKEMTQEKIASTFFPNQQIKDILTYKELPSCIVWFGDKVKATDRKKNNNKARQDKKKAKGNNSKNKGKEEFSITVKRRLNGNVYVSLGYIEDIITLCCKSDGLAMSEIVSLKTLYMPEENDSEGNKTKRAVFYETSANSPYLFSYDSNVCIIPKTEGQYKKTPGIFEKKGSSGSSQIEKDPAPVQFNPAHSYLYYDLTEEHFKKLSSVSGTNIDNIKAIRFIRDNKSSFGAIRNILVNVAVITDILDKKPMSIENFIESLLIRINDSITPVINLTFGVDDVVLGRSVIREANVFVNHNFPTATFKVNMPSSIVLGADISVRPSEMIVNAMSISAMYSNSKVADFNLSGGVKDFIQELLYRKEQVNSKQDTVESLTNELNQLPRKGNKEIEEKKKELKNKIKHIKETEEAERKRKEVTEKFIEVIEYSLEVSEAYKAKFKEFVLTLFRNYEREESKNKKYEKTRPLFPIEISLEIEGLSGILYGDYIFIEGLPERYKEQCYFMVKGISHQFSGSDWKTKIDCLSVIKE